MVEKVKTFEDVCCPFCGTLCDDLEIDVDIKTDQVFEEFLLPFEGIGCQILTHQLFCKLHLKCVFCVDGVDFIVHVEHLSFIKAERFDDVVEGVRVDRLFKSLAKEILARFWVGHMLEN